MGMFCITCNHILRPINFTLETSPVSGGEISGKDKYNELLFKYFLNYFNIHLSLTVFQPNLVQNPFCTKCRYMVGKLVDLNQHVENLKQELEHTDNWVKSQIRNISPEDKTRTTLGDGMRENVGAETLRRLIVGPVIKLKRVLFPETEPIMCKRQKPNEAVSKPGNESPSDDLEKFNEFEILNRSPESPGSTSVLEDQKYIFCSAVNGVEGKQPNLNLAENKSESETLAPIPSQESPVHSFEKADCEDKIFNEDGEMHTFEDAIVEVPLDHENTVDEYNDNRENSSAEGTIENQEDEARNEMLNFENDGKLVKKSTKSAKKAREFEPIANGKGAVKQLDKNKFLYYDKLEFTGSDTDGYQCSKCANGWKYTNRHRVLVHLRYHLKYPEGPPRKYLTSKSKIKCEGKDRYIFDNKLEFTGNDEDGYKCSSCSEDAWTFPNIERLLLHFRIHLRSNNLGSTKCPKCDKAIFSPAGLRNHIKGHEESFILICDICGKSCKGQKALGSHKRFNHRNDEYRECDICGVRIKGDAAHLKNHKSRVHFKKEKWYCEFCGKGFSYLTSLQIHLESSLHSSEQRYDCQVCGEKFWQKSSQIKHVKQFHSKTLVPESQEVQLEAAEPLEKAADKVFQDKGTKKLQSLRCKICGLQYHQNRHLTRHLSKIHHINKKQQAMVGK